MDQYLTGFFKLLNGQRKTMAEYIACGKSWMTGNNGIKMERKLIV
jgi:hypothetical protein